MITVIDGKYEIQISDGYWTGKEKVYFDKRLVSEKWSVGGAHHIFNCQNEEDTINYEVEINLRWHWFGKHITVRKNGAVIFSNK